MSCDIFHKYYLNEKQIVEIIKNGLIVYDTSAMLDLYFYSENSLSFMSKRLFPALANRLWVPAQVYFEFLKNKDTVLKKPEKEYRRLLEVERKKEDGGYITNIKNIAGEIGKEELKEINSQLQTLGETLKSHKKHPYVEGIEIQTLSTAIEKVKKDIEDFEGEVSKFEENARKRIEERIEELKTLPDYVLPIIDKWFEVGSEYSFEKMIEIIQEGIFRYAEKIPPGYMDESKNGKQGFQKYGDLFAWKQILEKSEQIQKDVLLVTNDVKEDWWDKEQESPRYELLREFSSVTGKKMWTCKSSDFLYLFEKATGIGLPEVIEEIKQIEKEKRELTEKDSLYRELLDAWLSSQTSAWIEQEIEINKEWRIFGDCHVYKGRSLSDGDCIIMLNILEGASYARILHSFENLWEIIKHYESMGHIYAGFQFILVKSKEVTKEVMRMMRERSKLYKVFDNSRVKNAILCLDGEDLIYVTSNYQIGTREPSGPYDPRIKLEFFE